MIMFRNELPLDHTKSLESWANDWTKEIQEENKELDLGVGWDSRALATWTG